MYMCFGSMFASLISFPIRNLILLSKKRLSDSGNVSVSGSKLCVILSHSKDFPS